MKISIKQSNLKQALNDVKRVVPSNPQLPILQAVLLQAVNGEITLSATDLFTGIKTTVLGSVDESGSAAIPAKTFSDVVSNLQAGTVRLETQDTQLTIQDDQSKTVLQIFTPEDYPQFPTKQGESIQLTKETFEKIVNYVSLATAKDDSRPILTSVLFNMGDGLEVVATDGFRLATLSLNEITPLQRLLIPAKSLSEISRLYSKDEMSSVTLTVSTELKQVFCSFGEIEMIIRMMEGEFPPYQKIIPASFITEVVLDGSQLNQALKAALVFARESSNIVRLYFENDILKVVSSSPSLGNHESTIHLSQSIDRTTMIAFNAQYLLDFLNATKSDKIWLGMNESLQPALFRPEGMLEYRYIAMPFKVNEEL